MSINIGMEGHYEFIVTAADGSIVDRFDAPEPPVGPSCNLLTDLFFRSLASNVGNSSAFSTVYGSLSTSVATPTTTDTSLPNRVATILSSGTYVAATTGSGMDWYTTYTYTFYFAKNAYVGTFSTVGLCGTNDGNNLLSRLRLKDGNGDPTSMTLITDDQLTLVYTLKAKRPNTIATGQATIGGNVHDWTLAKYNLSSNVEAWVTYPCHWFSRYYGAGSSYSDTTRIYPAANVTVPGSLTESISTSSPYIYNPSLTTAYTNGNSYADVSLTIPETEINNSPITYIFFSRDNRTGTGQTSSGFASFTPPITKTNTQILTLTWRITFGRL